MDGFKRPPRPNTYEERLAAQTPPLPVANDTTPVIQANLPPLDITDAPTEQVKKPAHKKWMIIAALCVVVVVSASIAAYLWYTAQLKAVNPSDSSLLSVEIKQGETASAVAAKLKSLNLIRNQLAFEVYVKLRGTTIKAGTCRLNKTQDVAAMVEVMEKGCHDFKVVTFFPGATIEKPLYKPAGSTFDQTMYVRYRLLDAGFTNQQIDEALNKTYTSPLFAGKPAGTSLEGYVFGETYYIKPDATASDALQASFDQLETVVEQNDLVAKFNAHGLNLYQGITLASIVQRELNCEGKPTEERKQRCYGYEQTIAQVFLSRLQQGMSLGSDVTFIYAADMMGVAPSVDLDSPYNTRIHTGLPPGPIASPGELALKAVANPSNTNYLFFLAGDDGLIYFAATNAEHEANIRDHCQQLCGSL